MLVSTAPNGIGLRGSRRPPMQADPVPIINRPALLLALYPALALALALTLISCSAGGSGLILQNTDSPELYHRYLLQWPKSFKTPVTAAGVHRVPVAVLLT